MIHMTKINAITPSCPYTIYFSNNNLRRGESRSVYQQIIYLLLDYFKSQEAFQNNIFNILGPFLQRETP